MITSHACPEYCRAIFCDSGGHITKIGPNKKYRNRISNSIPYSLAGLLCPGTYILKLINLGLLKSFSVQIFTLTGAFFVNWVGLIYGKLKIAKLKFIEC